MSNQVVKDLQDHSLAGSLFQGGRPLPRLPYIKEQKQDQRERREEQAMDCALILERQGGAAFLPRPSLRDLRR